MLLNILNALQHNWFSGNLPEIHSIYSSCNSFFDFIGACFKGVLKSQVHLNFLPEYLHEQAWPNDLTLTYHFRIPHNMYLGVLWFRTNFLEFFYLYILSKDLMRLQMHCRQPKPWCFLGPPQGVALKLVSPLKIWKEKY